MERGDVPLSEKRYGEARAPRTTPETAMVQNWTISGHMGCGGKVTIELRLDSTMAIRFGEHHLHYHEIVARNPALGALPPRPSGV
jgi:hypothetical protein